MIKTVQEGEYLYIGESPQLIINLKNQENYIKTEDHLYPYHTEVHFSDDLLAGKRPEVFETAVMHYYQKACHVMNTLKRLDAYRQKINTLIREKK